MSVLRNLFSNLYCRFNKEPDLCDITWAVCETSSSFQYLFLRFFFPTIELDKINSFTREFKKDDSRADFLINNNTQTYVIECKIYDKKHHFEQYVKTYNISNNQLGYIVNYQLSKDGFIVKTWEEFNDYITNNLPDNQEELELYNGYLEYLRSVCGIIKIKTKMELKGIFSLYNFNIVFRSVINRESNDYLLSYYNTDFKESYYGYKFKVESKNKEDIWLSAGLWFNRENPVITIGVWKREGWGKPFCDEIERGKSRNEKYAKKHYWEDSSFYFEGSDIFYHEFENASTVDDQKQVLCNFVDEVVNYYVKP